MPIPIIGSTASLKKLITDEDIKQFSNISLDINPIHLNEDFAAKSIFKKRIAHGFLVSSLISAVIGNKLPGHGSIYLNQTIAFRKPVYIGDTVEAIVTVVQILKPNCYRLNTVCKNQNAETVIEGEALVKYESNDRS